MSAFEAHVQKLTASGPDRVLPGCVLTAFNGDGVFYEKSFGTESVDDSSPLGSKPISPDTIMWFASCTKLVTAVSVLQCVEKGLLDLDADVSTILPEFKEPDIIKGFNDETGEPVLEKAQNKITLRLLMTHSSGLSYPFMNPLLQRFKQNRGLWPPPEGQSFHDANFVPLLYEPGTAWCYGVGLDWAGEMVARVTNQTLGSYMSKNIFEPLGMNSTTFRIGERADLLSRRADITMRVPGSLINSPTRMWHDSTADDHGGAGLFSCASDYVKLLAALLRTDGLLLQPASLDELFRPQLSAGSKTALNWTVYESDWDANFKPSAQGMSPMPELEGQVNYILTGNLPRGTDIDYSLGGLMNGTDVVTENRLRRKKDTLVWGGLPNLSWALNREDGAGVFYASQLLPPGDRPTVELFKLFEEAVNAKELS